MASEPLLRTACPGPLQPITRLPEVPRPSLNSANQGLSSGTPGALGKVFQKTELAPNCLRHPPGPEGLPAVTQTLV